MSGPGDIDVERVLTDARRAMDARRVFGEPVEADGLTVIPAAAVRGGGGGGGGSGPEDQGAGSGAGFAVDARPTGFIVIRDGEVAWQPVRQPDRLLIGVLAIAGLALLVVRTAIVERARR